MAQRHFGTDITTSPRGVNTRGGFNAKASTLQQGNANQQGTDGEFAPSSHLLIQKNGKPYYDFGPASCLALADAITCKANARPLFKRGLAWLWNYNHEEAVECFTKCTKIDPECAMAFWGIAYSVSSNYNFPPGLACGFDAIQEAMRLKGAVKLNEFEEDLIGALSKRSSKEAKEAADPAIMNMGNNPELNAAFAEAMREVYESHPGNLDITAVYAESLMNLRPWAMWERNPRSGEITPADDNTLLIVRVLEENGMAAGAKEEGHPGASHPALCHLYCHALELSPYPARALAAADTLRTLMPDAGHLVHMPSHIDAWVGQWHEGLQANETAVAADGRYVAQTGKNGMLHKFYRMHNIHFVVWCAMHTGKFEVALEYAMRAEADLPAGEEGVGFMLGGAIPMGAVFLEAYRAMKWHVLVRFGKWEQILAEAVETDAVSFAGTIATAHYARGLAFAAKGMVAEAEAEQAKFLGALNNPALKGRVMHNNVVYDTDNADGPSTMGVSRAMLVGEIEYRRACVRKRAGERCESSHVHGHFEEAFRLLREAVRLSLELKYDEPWGQMQPIRHALGALLLEQGHVKEAMGVYREDLKLWKKNMWGLLGLKLCLERHSAGFGAGAARDSAECHATVRELQRVRGAFRDASRHADQVPTRTCFCARAQEGGCSTASAGAQQQQLKKLPISPLEVGNKGTAKKCAGCCSGGK